MDKTTFWQNINTVSDLLRESGLCGEQTGKLQALGQRLENKEFIISVFGQFKRGKSSFINAVLGEDILPVGIVPVTAVVTQIKYGPKSAVVSTGSNSREIPFADLAHYINEQSNPKNIKAVSSVLIHYPSALLNSGITLVDTPGVGSMHKHNSAAAHAFVQNSDAVIFMLSVDSPVNEIESDFLAEIREHAAKIYFAVNKTDVVSAGDLAEYLNYCQQLLCGIMATQEVKLYPVCAKYKPDRGIERLMADILADLDTEGDHLLLDSLRNKSALILKEAVGNIELYTASLSMPLSQLEEMARVLQQKLDALDDMSKQTIYLISQKTDALLENIRTALEQERLKMSAETAAKINQLYADNARLKPALLENKLRKAVESELTLRLSGLDQKGIALLKAGYESATKLFGENLDQIHLYLKTAIKELFQVEYPFAPETYVLSNADDFYISINSAAPAFLFDKNNLILLLPKARANKRILKRVLASADNDISCNITNMLSNYSYKIRESKRTFHSLFSAKTEELKKHFATFIEQTLSERKAVGEQYEDKIKELTELSGNLKRCLDNILQPSR